MAKEENEAKKLAAGSNEEWTGGNNRRQSYRCLKKDGSSKIVYNADIRRRMRTMPPPETQQV